MRKTKNRGMENDTTPAQATTSLIAAGTRLEGEIMTDGTVRIEGSVKGSINAGKAVVVGVGGEFEGEIVTQDASIFGTVTGRITSHSRLEVKAEGRVNGEVTAKRMQLDLGGQFNGVMVVGNDSSDSNAGRTLATDETETGDVQGKEAS